MTNAPPVALADKVTKRFGDGPLVLRDALLTLAGPAWDLSVDDAARQVCFQRWAAATNSAITAPNVDQAKADETRREQP